MLRLRQRLSLPAILAILLPPLAYPEQLLLGQSFYFMDLAWFHYPLRAFIADQWRSGTVPLWNPYSWMGFPLLAESEAGALGVVNALFLLPIATWQALNLLVLLHVSIAGVSAYALARQTGVGPWASLLAALTFACGGWITAQVTNLNIMIGAAWAPLICALLLRAIERRSIRAALLGGVVFALQITSAHPQMPYFTVVLLGACMMLGALRCQTRRDGAHSPVWRTAAESGFFALLVGAVGAGLGAPQWLTAAELLSLSRRAQGLPDRAQLVYSMPPVNLLALAFPRLFLYPADTLRATGIFDEFHFYLGLIPLIALIGAWSRRRDPLVLFSFLLAAISALLALGHFTPLFGLASRLPLLSSFRVPARWLFVTAIAAIPLVGHGAGALMAVARDATARPQLLRVRRLLTMSYVALALTVPVALLIRPPDPAALRREDLFSIERFSTREQVAARLPTEAVMFTLVGGVALAAFWWLGARPAARTPAAALFALAGLDLFAAGGAVHVPPSYWDGGRPLAEFVQQNDSYARVFSTGGFLDVVPRLGDAEPAHWRVFASSGENDLPLGLQRTEDVLSALPFVQYLRLTGTRWLVIPRVLPNVLNRHASAAQSAAESLPLAWQSDLLNVYAVQDPLPRAFVVYDVAPAATPGEALSWLADSAHDLHQSAVVEGTSVRASSAKTQSATPASFRRYAPLDVRLDVNPRAEGLLVLTDAFYPGWHAWVDGIERPVIRADYLFRGVWLDAGQHEVEFRFESETFRAGALASGVTAFLVLTGWLVAPRAASG